ncbi:MAG: PSD1 and planctomycete cytochrome C domain-containing protein [Pirellulales bacterium]
MLTIPAARAAQFRSSLVANVAALLLALATAVAAPAQEIPTYNKDIRPILSDRCFKCHGPDSGSRQADLRLDRQDDAHAAAIVPGEADESELIARITSDDPDLVMPPPDSKKPRLTAAEIDRLRRWIDAGAKYERHWAYIPPVRPEVPAVRNDAWARNDVDRFVLARQEAAGIEPSAEADRRTLVRRLYFDLTGLPPTAEEVEEFVLDNRPDAYEQLVDRLLASPAYGERLATWWFDLVRFADTVGYHGDQGHRITPYRDYVIKSFNDNLPFDQFTIEQLAGDLLPNPTLWQRVATGYNRLLQTTHEGGAQDAEYRVIMQADRVRNFSETWLAGSMGCAQCHDHKFDPYTQRDFYSLAAFFADVDHYGSYEPVGKNVEIDVRPPEIMAWTLPVYNELQEVDAKIAEAEKKLTGDISPDWQKDEEALTKLKERRVALEGQFEPTMVTEAIDPPTTRILARGNWMDTTGEVVQPATPPFLPPLATKPDSAGRRANRLDLARWLTSRDHPLTARVVANRLWKRYFGLGLSKILIDMGSQGEAPPDQPLLDWLAVDFMESGWDVKRFIRQLVTSSTYRQASLPRPDLEAIDPDNRLVARQGRFRMEAEQIRDNALAVSGLLVNKVGGAIVRPYQPALYYQPLNFPEREYQPSSGEDQFRRAVYVHWQRQFPHPWLVAFDAPARTECTADRMPSNTPNAAMVLLNDPSYVEAARALAARVLHQEAAKDDAQRIAWAWKDVLGREPESEEAAELRRLLDEHRTQYAADRQAAESLTSVGISPRPTDTDVAELAAWTSVSRVLLNLNETITRN